MKTSVRAWRIYRLAVWARLGVLLALGFMALSVAFQTRRAASSTLPAAPNATLSDWFAGG